MNSSNLEVPTTLLPYDSRVFELEHYCGALLCGCHAVNLTPVITCYHPLNFLQFTLILDLLLIG